MPVRVLRILAAAHALSAVVFLVTWDFALADGAAPDATSPTVRVLMVIFCFGFTLLPDPLSTVGTWPIFAPVSIPDVTRPTMGYCGVAGLASLKKIRNWLPFVPGGLPISATVPWG